MVELVDTQDLKSCEPYRSYGFDSRSRYKAAKHLFCGFCYFWALLLVRMRSAGVLSRSRYLESLRLISEVFLCLIINILSHIIRMGAIDSRCWGRPSCGRLSAASGLASALLSRSRYKAANICFAAFVIFGLYCLYGCDRQASCPVPGTKKASD